MGISAPVKPVVHGLLQALRRGEERCGCEKRTEQKDENERAHRDGKGCAKLDKRVGFDETGDATRGGTRTDGGGGLLKVRGRVGFSARSEVGSGCVC